MNNKKLIVIGIIIGIFIGFLLKPDFPVSKQSQGVNFFNVVATESFIFFHSITGGIFLSEEGSYSDMKEMSFDTLLLMIATGIITAGVFVLFSYIFNEKSTIAKYLHINSEKRKNKIYFFLFIAPALLLYSVFYIYPFFQGIGLSFVQWNGITPEVPTQIQVSELETIVDYNLPLEIKTDKLYKKLISKMDNENDKKFVFEHYTKALPQRIDAVIFDNQVYNDLDKYSLNHKILDYYQISLPRRIEAKVFQSVILDKLSKEENKSYLISSFNISLPNKIEISEFHENLIDQITNISDKSMVINSYGIEMPERYGASYFDKNFLNKINDSEHLRLVTEAYDLDEDFYFFNTGLSDAQKSELLSLFQEYGFSSTVYYTLNDNVTKDRLLLLWKIFYSINYTNKCYFELPENSTVSDRQIIWEIIEKTDFKSNINYELISDSFKFPYEVWSLLDKTRYGRNTFYKLSLGISDNKKMRLKNLLTKYNYRKELVDKQKNYIMDFYERRGDNYVLKDSASIFNKMKIKRLLKKVDFSTIKFVGFDNFIKIPDDSRFSEVVNFSLFFTFFNVLFINLIGLLLALALDSHIKNKNFLRTLFFMSNVLSLIIVAYIWSFIYREVFRDIYQLTGIKFFNLAWLGDVRYTPIAVVITSVWQGVGYIMVIYLAGLQNIPSDILEVAEIDGAGGFAKFFKIILPLLFPAMTICFFITLTNSLKTFEIMLALTNGSYGTESYVLNIYNEAFRINRVGYSSAKAIILLVIIMIVSTIQLTIMKKREIEY